MITDRTISVGRFLHLVLMLAILAIVGWLLFTLRAVLVPFLIALLLAYLLEPGVQRVQKLVKNRTAAVSITLLALVLVITGLFMLLVPMITHEAQHFARLMSEELPAWEQQLQDQPLFQEALRSMGTIDVQQYLTGENLMNVAKKVLPGFWQGLTNVFGWLLGLVGVFTTLIYLVFIMIDEERLKANWTLHIPAAYRERVVGVVNDLERVMNLYFRGQLKIAGIMCVLYIIGFSLMGLPMAIVLGLLAGLLSLIPYFAILSVVPVAFSAGLLALDTHGSFATIMALALVVYAVVQGIEGFVLTPWIQGKNTGLQPAYILLALSVWGSLLGLVGMIIALPMTTLLISYYNRFVLEEEEVQEVPAPIPSSPGTDAGT